MSYEMARPWFDREARRGLRLICEFDTHPAVQPRRHLITGMEFKNARDLDLFIRDVPRSSPERDYEDIKAVMLHFDAWELAEDWMRAVE